jgi:hypothetical protein
MSPIPSYALQTAADTSSLSALNSDIKIAFREAVSGVHLATASDFDFEVLYEYQ